MLCQVFSHICFHYLSGRNGLQREAIAGHLMLNQKLKTDAEGKECSIKRQENFGASHFQFTLNKLVSYSHAFNPN